MSGAGSAVTRGTRARVSRPSSWGAPGARAPGARDPVLAGARRAGGVEVLVQARVVTPRGCWAADLFLRAERQAGLGERGQVRVGDGRDWHRQDVDLRALVVQHPEGHVEVGVGALEAVDAAAHGLVGVLVLQPPGQVAAA